MRYHLRYHSNCRTQVYLHYYFLLEKHSLLYAFYENEEGRVNHNEGFFMGGGGKVGVDGRTNFWEVHNICIEGG